MRYEEHPPPPVLAPYVHCLWTFEGEDAAEPQRIVPDGRSELILHWRTPYLERDGEGWIAQPRALFAGQLTRPLHLLAEAPAGVVGVRFRTAGARAFTHDPLDSFTDRRVPMADAPDLAACPLAAAVAYVTGRLDPRRHDTAVARAVAALRASEGRLPLADLCDIARLGPRVLQRRFLEAVGVSPRTLASVIRFRRVFDAVQDPSVTSWTDAAQAAGYFDHPQLARDFRRFVGCTPSAFLAGRPGLAASLVEA